MAGADRLTSGDSDVVRLMRTMSHSRIHVDRLSDRSTLVCAAVIVAMDES